MAQRVWLNRKTCIATGLLMIIVSLLLFRSLLQSPPALGSTLSQADIQQNPQQPVLVNDRAIYAVPIISGPEATAILQNVAGSDLAYVVHSFQGWGKSVSTAVSWFRCADIVQLDEYRGSQIEVETWFLLTEQERREVQAACTL